MTDDEDTSEFWTDWTDAATWTAGDDEGGADRPSHDRPAPHGQA